MEANENQDTIRQKLIRVRMKDSQAFSELLAEYEPLVQSAVFRYGAALSDFDRDDLYQVATIALHRAALNYDLEQNEVSFGLFAKVCVTNALITYVKKLGHSDEAEASDPESVNMSQGEGDPAQRLMDEEAAQLLHARIRTLLSPFENRVWSLYTTGYSAKEIAAALGKEHHSIENAVYRIRQKLRKNLRWRG